MSNFGRMLQRSKGGVIIPGGVQAPSLRAQGVAGPRERPIFDSSPHRNRGMAPAPELAPELMNEVIAECVAFGMPAREAQEARANPYVRTHLIVLWTLIRDAREGNAEAKAALDRIRFAFENREAVGEIVAAHEQPPDSSELTKLMGGEPE